MLTHFFTIDLLGNLNLKVQKHICQGWGSNPTLTTRPSILLMGKNFKDQIRFEHEIEKLYYTK